MARFSKSFVLSLLLSKFHLECPHSKGKERAVPASLEGLYSTVLLAQSVGACVPMCADGASMGEQVGVEGGLGP